MPRAKSTCSTDGCPKIATSGGKCPSHRRPAWQGSPRNVSRPASWRMTRKQALARDAHQCVLCGASATDVDHILPVALGGAWSLGNAQSLCGGCHALKTMREAAARRKAV